MVKKGVDTVESSRGKEGVKRSLNDRRVTLHHIRSNADIEAICREVIQRVDDVQLVRITPEPLEHLRKEVQRKVKKNTLPPLPELTEVEVNAQSAKIRNDWNSKSWELNPPHGWAWRKKGENKGKKGGPKKEIVALVYETKFQPGEHEIFIDKEIYADPRRALGLIENMNKRLAVLMAWDKKTKKIGKNNILTK